MVKKQCKTFEEGADVAIASLERQIKKRKEKLRARTWIKFFQKCFE